MNSLIILLSLFSLTMAANQTQKHIKLNDGNLMPILGYGSGGSFDIPTLKHVIEVGYRHIDTALQYQNEKQIGKAIKELIQSGKVKRQDLFITTKVSNNYHSREHAVKSVNVSLNNLGLDYIDLVLIHWPFGYKEGDELRPIDKDNKIIFSDVDYIETWKGLEDAHAKGLAKSIGVSNFNHKQLERVFEIAKIQPAVNQIECHPYFNQLQLIEFCHNHSIAIIAYSPLGKGSIINDTTIKSIANKHNKTAAQVILRYQIERNVVVIPKSTNIKRIEENFNVFDFTLTQEEVRQIDGLNKNERINKHEEAKNHKYYPFNEPY